MDIEVNDMLGMAGASMCGVVVNSQQDLDRIWTGVETLTRRFKPAENYPIMNTAMPFSSIRTSVKAVVLKMTAFVP